MITLTYNNNTVIKSEYENGQTIFKADNNSNSDNKVSWMGIWYLNFSHIPFVPNQQSTISLNNSFLVRMYLEYDHVYGNVGAKYFKIQQFLCFNSNLEIIFIYIPLTQVLVA